MGHLTQERLRHRRRLGRGKFQHHTQVVGQLIGAQVQAGFLVGLDQVDHGGPPVTRVAVDVLKQVQRRGAAAVKGLDIAHLDRHRIQAQQLRCQRPKLVAPRGGKLRFAVYRLNQLGHFLSQILIRIGQQQGQSAQGISTIFHGKSPDAQTMALMGIVRVLVPPNKLTSLVPSEQPLPNENPQPPRRSKVFSAYSRWVLGITNRSS